MPLKLPQARLRKTLPLLSLLQATLELVQGVVALRQAPVEVSPRHAPLQALEALEALASKDPKDSFSLGLGYLAQLYSVCRASDLGL